MSTPHSEYAKKARREFVARYREKMRNRWLFKRCSVTDGLLAKAEPIRKGKGKNGRSMSPELLARHGIVA